MKHETRLIILLTVLSAVMAVPECRSGADAEELPQTTHIQNTPVQVEIRLSSSPTPEIAVSSNEIIYGLAVQYAREEQYPQIPEIAIISSDYHILRQRTGAGKIDPQTPFGGRGTRPGRFQRCMQDGQE